MKTTLDEMQLFVSVVDLGSISAAAEQLELTVSAASRTLTRLEHKLDTTLLNRTTRRLTLTDEGASFLEQARSILDSVNAAEEQMAARKHAPAGRLRVDAATPFMLHAIVPLVPGFRERYPDIELELNSNEGITDLIEHRIGALKDSTLHARKLATSRVRVLASPAYLEKHGTPRTIAQLLNADRHVLLGFSKPESLNEWPLRHPDGEAVQIQPQILSPNGETLRHLALSGQGIVCLSDFMTREDRASGALVQLFARQTLEVRQSIHAVYYRNTALASRISCFVDYLAAELKTRSATE